MLDVSCVQNLSIVEGVQEEGLLWEPAQRERQDDDDEHFDYLRGRNVSQIHSALGQVIATVLDGY